jgi:hypothetical protein
LAPTRTLTAGIGFRTKTQAFGAHRVRSMAERPATEDGALRAEGRSLVDAMLGQRVGDFELSLEARNVLDARWRAVQFATESRLGDEAAPVEEIHFTPGWPRTLLASATAYF